MPLSKSYVRDSTHLINILQDFSIQPGILLCTLDVTSLYTNIPHLEGIQCTKEMLAIYKPPDTLPHNSYIIELLELVLTNNHFEFNGEFYHQLSGTAMGTKLAPSYANLFMTKFEDKYVYTYPLQPLLWKRYIDDIFLVWPHGKNSLNEFIKHLNTVHSTIKFTSDMSDTQISFLDLTIYIKQSALHTKLYTKPTDRHMYLNYLSEHPMSLKKSIPYSQFLRLKKIHSEPQHLLESCIHLGLALLYFKELISKHWAYLARSSATRDFGQKQFMVTYRRPPSLKDQLGRARIMQPIHSATQAVYTLLTILEIEENSL